MKTQTENTREQQNDNAPKVQQEHSTGGTATVEDHRPATVYQRKLRAAMNNSSRNQATAQLRKTMNAYVAAKASPVQRKANNTGLPDSLKSGIENLSGYAMDDVKVYYNSSKPAQLQAHAYAQGTDIHLAPGQEKHLPHEAWHVVQQKQGRVKPTRQLKSKVNINDDAKLEKEADVMGSRALQSALGFSNAMPVNSVIPLRSHVSSVVQPVWAVDPTDVSGDTYADGQWRMSRQTALIWHQSNPDDRKTWSAWREDDVELSLPDMLVNTTDGTYGAQFHSSNQQWQGASAYATRRLNAAAAADSRANVRKAKRQKIKDTKMKSILANLDTNFELIDREMFNNHLWGIAKDLVRIANYTCIVSPSDKSNYWITARVLKLVEILGGSPPREVIAVPTKEQGTHVQEMSYYLGIPPNNTVVFIDDASYSGSQLSKLVKKVAGHIPNPVAIGVVAKSQAATTKVETLSEKQVQWLGQSHTIQEGNKDELDMLSAYKKIKLSGPGHPTQKDAPDGNFMAALYYKLPDYASVRTELLMKTGIIAGYHKPGGGKVNNKRVYYPNAVEPYKHKHSTIDDPYVKVATAKQARPASRRPAGNVDTFNGTRLTNRLPTHNIGNFSRRQGPPGFPKKQHGRYNRIGRMQGHMLNDQQPNHEEEERQQRERAEANRLFKEQQAKKASKQKEKGEV